MIMFITAAAGLLVNLAMMKVLHQGHGHSHGGGGGGHGHSHGVFAAAAADASKPQTGPGASHGHGHSHSHGLGLKTASSSSKGHGHSHGGSTNINVQAAFIHVLGDLVQSVGVMLAAIIIWVRPEWHVAGTRLLSCANMCSLPTQLNRCRSNLHIYICCLGAVHDVWYRKCFGRHAISMCILSLSV